MDENKKHINKRLSVQLPKHSPDSGMWQAIESRLDAIDADLAFQKKLDELPLHSPDAGTWNSILFRLNRAAFLRTGKRIALAAAAGLLLFFTVSRILDNPSEKQQVPVIAQQNNTLNSSPSIENSVADDLQNKSDKESSGSFMPANENQPAQRNIKSIQVVTRPEIAADYSFSDDLEYLSIDMSSPENIDVNFSLSALSTGPTLASAEPNNAATSILFKSQNTASASPPVKYYTPKEPGTESKNHFALAMNYLPENIDNGTDNSLFHNVDLTASYNKEKVRFNTSFGMAYNEEQLVFDMNYDINTPVTLTGPTGSIDTVGYDVATLESQYQGTEKHQYFTYNLGIGRKIFSIGKFSSWINAGAGFGIKLNDPNLIASTEKSIKGQYNATINHVTTTQPEYNNVNVNFVTGIDFNYKLFDRLSFTFTPTSRWYFKPVLIKDNKATDELTLGFKTGMKFEF